MNILRINIKDKNENDFLIDAEHEGGKIVLLKIHPIIDGTIQPTIPPCHFDNVKPLVDEMQKMILAL